MLRVYSTPFSTNGERVALALAHKGLEVEWIQVPYDDRREVEAVSGQTLVPVLVDGDLVIPDSVAIIEHLEARHPKPPLYPSDPARRAETIVFVDWFNRVWKRPPNELATAIEEGRADEALVAKLGGQIAASLPIFEALLERRSFLLGEALGVADLVCFPFLKYATVWDEGDEHLFHELLRDHQRLDGRYPRLEDWIARLNALPRA